MTRRTLLTALLAGAAGFALGGCPLVRRPVALTSVSPDGASRVRLVERPVVWLDRNFDVTLEDVGAGAVRTVFASPDEGQPGTERVAWTADGAHFLLLGRHFYLTADSREEPRPERPYLLMNVRTGQMWCDASQQSRLPPIPPELLASLRWLQWSPPAPAAR